MCACCNSIRLTGKSPSERQAASVKKYQDKQKDKPHTLKRTIGYRIPQQSKKESGIKSQLSTVKNNLRLESVQNDEHYCKGCGKGSVNLDCSHILSVGQFKHLELNKENIQLMCRDCHRVWESGQIEEQMALHCFTGNLVFIYFYDQESFSKFLTRIEDYNKWLVDDVKIACITNILSTIEEGIELAG